MLQLALRDYACSDLDDYWRVAERVASAARIASHRYYWRITFLGGQCSFRLGRDPEVTAPSLLIYFWALGKTARLATRSREALLACVRITLFGQM
jgi:hypothetical protein